VHKVEKITSTLAPLDIADIDTDQIIPAVWMKRIERSGFEDGLFQQWRRDPEFILNHPERRNATVLIAGPNFGCGSSREHAPWALRDYGFTAVIAPSFADIFKNNLANVGLVPVRLGVTEHRTLMDIAESDPKASVTIDVRNRTVRCESHDFVAEFDIADTAQHQLVNGLDPIDLTLELEAEIAEHEKHRPWWMPVGTGVVEEPFEKSGVKEAW